MDKRSICAGCMWMIFDQEGTCWEYCKGRLRPGIKVKKIPVVYHVDSWAKFVKILPLLQKDDIIYYDENGMMIKHEET